MFSLLMKRKTIFDKEKLMFIDISYLSAKIKTKEADKAKHHKI